ncbi:MAG TPA: hypothetical protein VFD82_18475 [Planctomycetota bacterium]|nr:hypothetical protein [Planctomycetota bacterium]
MRLTFVAVLLALGSRSDAQSWSISAHAPFVGTATASTTILTNSATLPVGNVMPGTFLTCSVTDQQFQQVSGFVSMIWGPSVVGSSAPLAFTTSSSCASQGGYPYSYAVSASGSAQIDFTLRAPQPVGGRLLVRFIGSDVALSWGSTASSRIDLDVNADGTIEVSAYGPPASTPLDVPLQIPATGAVIRLIYNTSTFAPPSQTVSSAVASRTIEAQFFPGEPAVAPFATFSGASTMSVDHGSPGMVTLSIAGPGLTPVLMAFGGTALSVPWLPYVTVLVSPDVLIGTTGSITLQLPPLPPGALYAQGLVVDSVGTLRGTNSVRFLWL